MVKLWTKTITVAALIAAGVLSASTASGVSIDDFTDFDTTNLPPTGAGAITVSDGYVVTGVSSTPQPMTFAETGLSGTIGGVRNVGSDNFVGMSGSYTIELRDGTNLAGPHMAFSSGPSSNVDFNLTYDNGPMDLNGNPVVVVHFENLDMGMATMFDVSATLDDGTNSETLMETLTETSAFAFEVPFDFSASSVDISSLDSISFDFAPSGGPNVDTGFIISGISATAIPEPSSILLWSLLCGVLVVGYRRLAKK